MISRYSSSNRSFMFSSKSFSMSLQNMFSQNVLFSNMFLRLWVIKSRVRFRLNAFTVTRKIIYTRKNASNSMKILKQKKFICRKEEFISIFIILKSFTFEWFLQKSATMRWKRREINLFESRRRSFDRSS
jgi:hypothetical protein